MAEAKPYAISKQVVWEAYQRVKANQGAAGVDGQSIEAFESDLKNTDSTVFYVHVRKPPSDAEICRLWSQCE